MKDRLPASPLKHESAVLNLDVSQGPGTHWGCYVKKNNSVTYYDSFGVKPPVELIEYFGSACNVSYNYEQEQDITQVICGHLCLLFLIENARLVVVERQHHRYQKGMVLR